MRIVRDVEACPDDCKGAVLALGNFDGVHLGHRAILHYCAALAQAENTHAALMTFEPHPREFFSRDHAPMRLTPLRCKTALIAESGIDLMFLARFNKRLAGTSAESFIRDILHEKLAVRHVVTGYNFAFGKGRQGGTAYLSKMAAELGFGFTAHQPVADAEGDTISSSNIRALLAQGNLEKAAMQLGRPFAIAGRVIGGERRGRWLGFPTANISLRKLFKPRLGVYAVRVRFDGEILDGVASIGTKPTFTPTEPLLEVHCFDMNRDLYGKWLQVELVEFLRQEERFPDEQTLVEQMKKDAQTAKTVLKETSFSWKGEGRERVQ